MNKQTKRRKRLRSGFTTGTAAAAAAKAAAMVLLGREAPRAVDIRLLNGETWSVDILYCHEKNGLAECVVIKDAGDDPDVTNKAEIGARVARTGSNADVVITGGEGVGRITKPGLEVAVGEPAINPGPLRMIAEAVREVSREVSEDAGDNPGFNVEVFVPEGETIARRTLNARLGIVGGISILGTTGVVKPMSHEAYIATIDSALSVAAACGLDTVVCTTGRRSERHAQGLFPDMPVEAFVQIGDFLAESMQRAGSAGMDRVILAVFFGKAIKIAQGAAHTHAARSRLALEELGGWMRDLGAETALVRRVADSNTAREAFFLLQEQFPEIFPDVVSRMTVCARQFAAHRVSVRAVLFDYSGEVVADTKEQEELT